MKPGRHSVLPNTGRLWSGSKDSRFWCLAKDGDREALRLYERHYSAYRYKDGRVRKLFVGPGFKTVLISPDADALFVWRKFRDGSGQKGINCAVFRNESANRSSDMILDAEPYAWKRWPYAKRLYTYVDADRVRSANPGCCFKKAGWRKCGKTKGGLLVFKKLRHWLPKVKQGSLI